MVINVWHLTILTLATLKSFLPLAKSLHIPQIQLDGIYANGLHADGTRIYLKLFLLMAKGNSFLKVCKAKVQLYVCFYAATEVLR